MKKLAVTGGLACGKSTVCAFLRQLGARVVSADEIVHRLFSSDPELKIKITNLLGPEVSLGGELNPKAIAEKVFENPERLQDLEKIIHPSVRKEIERDFLETKAKGLKGLFVAEIPLFFESAHLPKEDYLTLCVIAKRDLCAERFKKRTSQGNNEFDRRYQRQLAPREKARRSDFVIVNEGSLEDLKEQTSRLYQKLLTSHNDHPKE